MPRTRSPDSLEAEKLYRDSNGKMELVEIAKQMGIPEGTVRSWKNRYKWDNNITATLQKEVVKSKRNVANKKNRIKEPRPEEVPEVENPELTEKQRLFCIYYIRNFNASLAAVKAGYSPTSASFIGYENLTKPYIKTEIDRLKTLKKESIRLNEDDIVERYMRIAFADITDFVEFGQEDVPIMTMYGPLKDEDDNEITKRVNTVRFRESNVVDGGLICEIAQGKDGAKLKLEDRQKALDWLAGFFDMNPINKHKKLFDNAKLQLEKDKFAFEKGKASKGSTEDTVSAANEKLNNLAMLFSHPVKVRAVGSEIEDDDTV